MEHLRGEQYSEYPIKRNPRAYMSMRDFRNQWLSSPYGSTYNHSWGNHTNSSWEPRPPQYAPPEPPYYASTPESPQPPQSIPPFEQAILDLTRIVDDFVVENKGINAHSNQRIVTVEDNLNKKLDGLKNDFEHKWDNLQDSIEDLIDQQQCPLEEECQSDTMVEEQCQQQPHIEDFIELSKGLSESSDMCDVVFLRENQEEILPFITEEGSGKEIVEEPQELVLKPFPTELNPTATAQATKSPLPVAPSTDQVYILPAPASQSQHKTPEAPTTKATPSLLMLQNIRKLVATVRAFATTSKTQAAAHIAWHNGWFGCRFRFGELEPRHSYKLCQFK